MCLLTCMQLHLLFLSLQCSSQHADHVRCCGSMTSGDVPAQDCKLNAMTDMVQSFASIVESTCRLGSDAPEDDTLHAVAALYQSRANSAPTCRHFWLMKCQLMMLTGFLPFFDVASIDVDEHCWMCVESMIERLFLHIRSGVVAGLGLWHRISGDRHCLLGNAGH